jgi:hypothetical protein
MQHYGGAIMPAAVRSESRTHPREPSFVSILSGWAQQGAQSLFATQRILLDLAMRQNANVMHAVREQLSNPHHSPTAILSEMTGEGVSNFIEAQQVLLDLAQEQNELLMSAVKGRIGTSPAAHAVADLLGRSVETFLGMQQEFLKIAGKQTHTWVEAAKAGKPYQGEHLVDLTREAMENFVKAQKQFLDVIAEETERAIGGKRPVNIKRIKKTEAAELARQATKAFIEAQKKLFDVAGRQMTSSVKTAGKTVELLKPFPFLPLGELTREGVKSYVDAQKALMEVMVKPRDGHKREVRVASRAKRPARAARKEAAAHAVA